MSLTPLGARRAPKTSKSDSPRGAQRAAAHAQPDDAPIEAALYEDMTLADWRMTQGLTLAALSLLLKRTAITLKPNHPGSWGLTTVWRLCAGKRLPEPFEMEVIAKATEGAVTEAGAYRAARDFDADAPQEEDAA